MKQTEVGLIPDDWEVKKIEEFADVTTGNKNTQDAVENGKYPFYVRSPIVERINSFTFDSEGIITAGDGVGTGKVFHYAKGKFGLHQRAYLIHNFRNVVPKYFYFIFSKNFYERVHSMTAKSSVDSVRREMITKMQIPIPPTLAEQQRIANALSDVDALISTTEKLIQKKKNIKQGAMQNLLTGKKRLPGFGEKQADLFVPNGTHTKEVKDVSPEQIRLSTKKKQTELGEIPEDWEVKTLGEISTIIMGQSPKSDCYNTQKGMVLIQGNADISNRKTICRFYTTHITKSARKGDVIFTVRAPVGNVAKATFDCCLGRGVCAIQRISDFLYYYLIYIEDSWSKTSTGSTFDSINSDTLASTLIIQPSSKEEQTAIANVLSSMDKEIETLNTKLEKYRNLKTAMMQQLLTGKIRLLK